MPEGKKALYRLAVIAAVVGVFAGLVAGVGGYTFLYAEGASYMTNDPAACMNCHIMKEQYDGWQKSSHHAVAVCNDCHAPHDLVGKYATKAINGWNHSLAFTTGDFHEPIQITESNRQITESACRYCHAKITEEIDFHPGVSDYEYSESESISCIRCHNDVGHMH